MKGKSQQILEFLYKNRNAYTNEEILSNLSLENENDKISKTLYDMKKKRGLIILVGADRYRITEKGLNHAAISYGMSDKDLPLPIKTSPAKKLIGVDITEPKPTKEQVKKFYAKKPDIEPLYKCTWPVDGENVKTKIADLEKVLKYKPSNKLEIKDLDQKLEVLGVISRFVDSKLSYWVEEIAKDLKG